MKLSEAISEIIKRSDEDFDNEQYRSRASMLFQSVISTLVLDKEYSFTDYDFKGLVIAKKLTPADVISIQIESGSNAWNTALDVCTILDLSYYNANNTKILVLFENLQDYSEFINNVLSQYEDRIGFVQKSNKIIASKDITGLDIYITYVKPFVFNDSEIFGVEDDELELEQSFSIKFINTAIMLTAEQLKTEIKGRDQ